MRGEACDILICSGALPWIDRKWRAMAIIVEHARTGEHYILLGSGFGAYQSLKSTHTFGDIIPEVDKGKYAMLCVSDRKGTVGWLDSTEVKVVSVDGKGLEEFF